MLISTLDVTSKVKKGDNVIALEQRGTESISTLYGDRRVPKMVYIHVAGASLSGTQTVEAPIDLFAGDILDIAAETGAVLRVWRGAGDPAWEAPPPEEDEGREVKVAAKSGRRGRHE